MKAIFTTLLIIITSGIAPYHASANDSSEDASYGAGKETELIEIVDVEVSHSAGVICFGIRVYGRTRFVCVPIEDVVPTPLPGPSNDFDLDDTDL